MWDIKNKSEISCVLAGLILGEKNKEISDTNIKNILISANIKIESYWPLIFSRCSGNFDKENNTEEMIPAKEISIKTENNKNDSKKDNNKKEQKENQIEEDASKDSEGDLGFGLFD